MPNLHNARIITLSGKAQSGKDAFARRLVEKHGWRRLAFADALKNTLYDYDSDVATLVDLVGWEEAKKATFVRSRLQNLGVAARNNITRGVWVEPVATSIRADDYSPGFVITDARFHNELDYFRWHGAVAVRIERPWLEDKDRGDWRRHSSEMEWESYDFHVVIYNDGTIEDLNQQADILLRSVEAGTV